jgi:hypothetical protein
LTGSAGGSAISGALPGIALVPAKVPAHGARRPSLPRPRRGGIYVRRGRVNTQPHGRSGGQRSKWSLTTLTRRTGLPRMSGTSSLQSLFIRTPCAAPR